MKDRVRNNLNLSTILGRVPPPSDSSSFLAIRGDGLLNATVIF